MAGIEELFTQSTAAVIMTKIMIAIIILLVGFILGRLVGKLIQRLMHELDLDKAMKRIGVETSLESVMGIASSVIIYLIAVILALNQLGITSAMLYIVGGIILVIIIVALLLGIKDFIPNASAGVVIKQRRKIRPGHIIKVKGVEGKVKRINLTETEVETEEGDTIYIPNSVLTKSEMTLKRPKN